MFARTHHLDVSTDVSHDLSVHEFRIGMSTAGVAFAGAFLFIGGGLACGFFLGDEVVFHGVVLMLIGLVQLGFAMTYLFDRRVQLRIDHEGLTSLSIVRRRILWSEIRSTSIVTETRRAATREFLHFRTYDGQLHEVEIGRLDSSVEEILLIVSSHLGVNWN